MLNLQLKQAETALADGRLDEACQLAAQSEVREHRGGQKLIGRIVAALLKRGDEHLSNDRFDEANRDCRAADRLAGNKPEIARLREQVNSKLKDNAIKHQQRDQLVRAARQEFQRGAISLGGRMLAQLDGDSQAEAVSRELQLRRESADANVQRVEDALRQPTHDAAFRELTQLKQDFPNHPKFEDLLNQLSTSVGKQLDELVNAGRLDKVQALLQRAGSLVSCSCHLSETSAAMDQLQLAADAVRGGQFRHAANTLTRMATILPKAKWIVAAVKDAKLTADTAEALCAGPLGMLELGMVESVPRQLPARNGAHRNRQPNVQPQAFAKTNVGNTDRCLLSVEGVGSFLVLRHPLVRIGSGSSTRTNDIGLMNAGSLPAISIERVQDDYFIRSERPISVNERKTSEKLLTNGDRIALNRRCHLKFLLPNPASTTAVLELSTAKLKRPDVRRVILFDESIVMDQTRAAHVMLQQAEPPVVIVSRNGSLTAKPMGRGVTTDQIQKIAHGETIVVGSTSFSIAPVDKGTC